MTWINYNLMQIAETHARRGKKNILHVDILLES
jgi:hypothetical protein